MSMRFRCDCGKALTAPESAAGRRGRCPGCGAVFTVPAVAEAVAVEPVPVAVAADDGFAFRDEASPAPRQTGTVYRPSTVPPPLPSRTSTVPAPAPLPPAGKARPYHYLVLLLALLPLAWSTLRPTSAQTLGARIKLTITHHPEVMPELDALPDDATTAQLCAILPGDRVEGALLAYDTYAHWGLAALSAAGFFGLVLLLFPPGHTKVWHLLAIGTFTGTAGILLLLGFQWLAFHMPLFRGGSIVTVVLDLIWLIGQSYRMALGDHGLVVSALGFTAGVGFCEEACKAIPLLFKVRGPTGNGGGFASWRSAMLWGLVSGVGFGVSEGVTYSHDYYNGILGGQIYAVRFVSCVALHAIWAAAVGIAIYRRRAHFVGHLKLMDWLLQTLLVVVVPMCLHGLYDTLLKQQYDLAALTVALASFGWLTWQVELAKRKLDPPTPSAGRGFAVLPVAGV